jgi:hypothetical protein
MRYETLIALASRPVIAVEKKINPFPGLEAVAIEILCNQLRYYN